MKYLLIYVKFIDQIIINHDKTKIQCDIVLKYFIPKVVFQPWMPRWTMVPMNNVKNLTPPKFSSDNMNVWIIKEYPHFV